MSVSCGRDEHSEQIVYTLAPLSVSAVWYRQTAVMLWSLTGNRAGLADSSSRYRQVYVTRRLVCLETAVQWQCLTSLWVVTIYTVYIYAVYLYFSLLLLCLPLLERCNPWPHVDNRHAYLHKPAVVIVTSFSLWCGARGARSPRSHYDDILNVTSFATQLTTPTDADVRTYVRTYTDTLCV